MVYPAATPPVKEKESKEKEQKDASKDSKDSKTGKRKSVVVPEVNLTLQAQTKEEAFDWLQKIQEAQVAIRIKNNAWERALENKGGAKINNSCCIVA